jgi:hypothetical protein
MLQEGVWIKVPCVKSIGSCTYDDLCTLLEKIPLQPDGTCPKPLPSLGIPCRCPIPSFRVRQLRYCVKQLAVTVSIGGLAPNKCICQRDPTRHCRCKPASMHAPIAYLCCPVGYFLLFLHYCAIQGDYKVSLSLTGPTGAQIGCAQLEFSLESPKYKFFN